MIKSTYNFVPAPNEDQVYTPEWANQVSHDVPFSDGESGEIELKITAETPIFIRNGHNKDAETNEFSHYFDKEGKKHFFIPGSSLKGLFRSVLEIMSFSRLNPNLVNDDRYSFRDLTQNSLYMKSYNTNKVCAGWMKMGGEGKWLIEECDFLHIHHKEVDAVLGTTFRSDYKTRPSDTSIIDKYNKVKGKELSNSFSSVQGKNKSVAVHDDEGKSGTIVFTGQSSQRKEGGGGGRPSGKAHEFVLFHETKTTYEVTDKQQKDFKFIYLDHDKVNISKAWEFWRERLVKGEAVPVFFNKSEKDIKHFGLAFMYKLPYENSIHEMFPIVGYNKEDISQDLATTIFGYTNLGEESEALKGRVMFGHAKSANAVVSNEKYEEILGGPKASFFPFYLDKSIGKNAYQKQGNLKGFKKYPVHNDVKNIKYSSDQLKNKKVFTTFRPLEKGSVFTTKIRYHNLRPVELGALVSAISFHAKKDGFHNLGLAKSLGFGKIKVEVNTIEKFTNEMQIFEYAMNTFLGSNWIEQKAIGELFALISSPSKEAEATLVNPVMGRGKGENDFINYKAESKYLAEYSSLNSFTGPQSLLTSEFKKEMHAKQEILHEKKLKREAALKLKFDTKIREAEQAKKDGKFVLALKIYKEAMLVKEDGSLPQFIASIELEKAKQQETEAYTTAMSSNSIPEFENFLNTYKFSIYKDKVEAALRKLKAVSGVPENIKNKDNFKQFANNTDNWVKKLPNKTILGSGFEEEHLALLIKIGKLELQNKKLAYGWQEGKGNEKRITKWYDADIAKDCLKKIV
ncbi:TIGR03986 family CRISPR-associated RAMP protein [Polaribacter litorisediminis]|uniref:TIGR03986 family type III CRISPR-associated RAMP protein n=1 Tax=Polaribacter litorisediminis TaxID=1908341 RepID=UPI001CBF6C32|nr:TIGR03986 family CRISPR-associated RAMP protein [Polaribacter litorisediminis]UAM97265.1 TIGR03986 family CRISPR-associated RAMP protein [Polaribacter litorisediminis]